MLRAGFCFLIFGCSMFVCRAQYQQGTGGLNRLSLPISHSTRASQLLREFREGSQESDAAARELIGLAREAITDKRVPEAVSIARDLFLSSAPDDVRLGAFNVLDKHASTHLAPHINEIRVLVPNTSCYGRFLSWLNKSVRDEFGWVHKVSIRNTHRVKNAAPGQLTIGTVAELTFYVDSPKEPADLAVALKQTQVDGMKGWSILVEHSIDSVIESNSKN